ncbi:MAG: hypothetical protein HFF11_09530 [Angelakisella sp.]|jgi:hypothetical protein|nr:hypothetical protein [Angelakisella sp.]
MEDFSTPTHFVAQKSLRRKSRFEPSLSFPHHKFTRKCTNPLIFRHNVLIFLGVLFYNKKEKEAVLQPPQALSRRDSRIKWKFDAAVPFCQKSPLAQSPLARGTKAVPKPSLRRPAALAAKRHQPEGLCFFPQKKAPYPANEPPAAKARTLVSGSTNPSRQHNPAAWRHQ